jgi:ribulose bisphosphate carboxylase small subunit
MKHLIINIEKSRIPLIWIDTSIIIDLAKIRAGKKLDVSLKERVEYIYDAIRKARHNKKAICPRGEQEREYEIGKNHKEECRRVQNDLAMGIRMKRGFAVEVEYMKVFMKAYINSESELNISYRDLFDNDPVEELNRIVNQGYAVNVEFPLNEERIAKDRHSWEESWEWLETLRELKVKDNMTFEQALEIEYRGTYDAYEENRRRFNLKYGNKWNMEDEEYSSIADFCGYLKTWKKYNGKPPGIEGLLKFFLSEYQMQIPKIEIHSNLFAKILTSESGIKSGDSMDLQQLSVVLPFFDLVITDKKMKHNIESFDYHRNYKTQVLALKDFDAIQSFFEELETN